MGGPAMLRRLSITPTAAVLETANRAASRGQAVVFLLTRTSAIAAFAVADAVTPESRNAVQRLHDQHIEVVMLTGDAQGCGGRCRRRSGNRQGICRGAAGYNILAIPLAARRSGTAGDPAAACLRGSTDVS